MTDTKKSDVDIDLTVAKQTPGSVGQYVVQFIAHLMVLGIPSAHNLSVLLLPHATERERD